MSQSCDYNGNICCRSRDNWVGIATYSAMYGHLINISLRTIEKHVVKITQCEYPIGHSIVGVSNTFRWFGFHWWSHLPTLYSLRLFTVQSRFHKLDHVVIFRFACDMLDDSVFVWWQLNESLNSREFNFQIVSRDVISVPRPTLITCVCVDVCGGFPLVAANVTLCWSISTNVISANDVFQRSGILPFQVTVERSCSYLGSGSSSFWGDKMKARWYLIATEKKLRSLSVNLHMSVRSSFTRSSLLGRLPTFWLLISISSINDEPVQIKWIEFFSLRMLGIRSHLMPITLVMDPN